MSDSAVEVGNAIIEAIETRNAGICEVLRTIGDNGIDRETGLAALAMLDFNLQVGKQTQSQKPVFPTFGRGTLTIEKEED